MKPLLSRPGAWWNSEPGRLFRFYALFFRWPVLLVLGAVIVDKTIFYGVLPLSSYVTGRGDYLAARMEFARGENQAAIGYIRAALLHTREDAAYWRLAAQLAQKLDSSDAAYCWQQVDRLKPGHLHTEIAFAEAALSHQQFDLADAALAEVSPDDQDEISYLCASAELADARGEKEQARDLFARVEASHPTDLETRFALAQWHAESDAPVEWRTAETQLRALLPQPQARLRAQRLLVRVALKENNFAEAQQWNDALLRQDHPPIGDRVQRLDILQGLSATALENELADLTRSTQRDEIVPVVEWMVSHNRAESALIWVRTLPEEMQDDPVIGIARADCLSALGLWQHLAEIQADDVWPGHEPQRLMYLMRAGCELHDEAEGRAAWQQAVLACRDYRDYLALLDYLGRIELPSPGERDDARAEVWLEMLARYPSQAWIIRSLLPYELARHDSLQVQNLDAQLAALAPNDPAAGANYDLVCLLRGSHVDKASASLGRWLQTNPSDPAVATAAAYDFYRQGRFGEALAAVGGLSREELDAPERAALLGAFLSAGGPIDEASRHLQVALARPELSDEERALANRAQDLLRYREAMAALLHSTSANHVPTQNFSADGSEASGIFLVGESVRLVRSGAMEPAARALASVDVSSLDAAGLTIYLGGTLVLASQASPANSYLELSPDLPAQTDAEKCRRALEAWWARQAQAPLEPASLEGLFAAYRGLDTHENDAAFWQKDQLRQLHLVRLALLRGVEIEAAQERLHGLLRHVPFSPEIQTEMAYALLRQGQPQAAEERMELLAPTDLAQPELGLYYGVILVASGERKAAEPYLRRAAGPTLLPEERELALQAEQTP